MYRFNLSTLKYKTISANDQKKHYPFFFFYTKWVQQCLDGHTGLDDPKFDTFLWPGATAPGRERKSVKNLNFYEKLENQQNKTKFLMFSSLIY